MQVLLNIRSLGVSVSSSSQVDLHGWNDVLQSCVDSNVVLFAFVEFSFGFGQFDLQVSFLLDGFVDSLLESSVDGVVVFSGQHDLVLDQAGSVVSEFGRVLSGGAGSGDVFEASFSPQGNGFVGFGDGHVTVS